MAKPRKKWEPVYRFGGNPANPYKPPPLGEFQWRFSTTGKMKQTKRRK